MAEKEPVQNGEFERELIRRFYNARSYFFLCFSEHLRDEVPPEKPGAEEDYALVAALLDRLQSSEDPRAELEKLASYPSFAQYLRVLDERVQQLKTAAMTPEELKEAIEETAKQFLDAVLQALRSDEGRIALAGYLGIELEAGKVFAAPDVDFVESRLAPQAPSGEAYEEEEFLLSHFRSIVERELGQVEDQQGEEKTLRDLERIFYSVRDAAMIHGEEEVETLCFKTAGLIRRARSGNAPVEKVIDLAEQVRHFVESYVSGKNRDEEELRVLIGVLQDALEGHYPEFPQLELEQVPPEDGSESPEKEPPEESEPASQSQEGEEPAPGGPEEAAKVAGEEIGLEEMQGSRSDQQEAESGLTEDDLDFAGLIGIDELLQLEEAEAGAGSAEGVGPQETQPGALAERASREPNVAGREDATEESEIPFKLPGEDDEELRELIREVKEHAWRATAEESPDNGSVPKGEAVEVGAETTQEKERESPEPGRSPYGEFQTDADLYLGVLENALAALRADPGRTSALEDIDLAAQSLKGLLGKLGDSKLWVVASSLGAAAARAARSGANVDTKFLSAAEQAVRLLRSGPGDLLDGEFREALEVLSRWEPEAGAGVEDSGGSSVKDTMRAETSPDTEEAAADYERPRFRLRGRRSVEH